MKKFIFVILFLGILGGSYWVYQNSLEKIEKSPYIEISSEDDWNSKFAHKLQVAYKEKGQGETVEKKDRMRVHYRGHLWEDGKRGKEFDSSFKNSPSKPLLFPPIGTGKLIKGWDQVLIGQKVGTKLTVIIPPELGYGDRPVGNLIPANSTLLFDIEIYETEHAPKFPEVSQDDKRWQTIHEEGLKILWLEKGEGATVSKDQKVSVHYSGWLMTEKLFDSTKNRREPYDFTLGDKDIIKGWNIGVGQMKVGDKILLKVPPELAYGSKGARTVIPPDATLLFEIELLEIKENKAAAKEAETKTDSSQEKS